MIKKTVSLVLCFTVVFALTSCGAKESSQIDYDETSVEASAETSVEASAETSVETSSGTTVQTATEIMTQADTKTAATTAAKAEKTTEAAKIYLDATDEDYKFLALIYEILATVHFCDDGFDCENSSFAYNLPIIYELTDLYFGKEEFHAGYGFPRGFGGLIHYDTFSEQRYERSVFDPLSRFNEIDIDREHRDLYTMVYSSIDAKTVEWIETELLGGKIDRQNLVTNKATMISCYYYDGRYYFQDPGERGGAGYDLTFTKKTQQPDGSYVLDFESTWGGTGRTTVALIEKDGEKYWKFFKIDWTV